MARVTVGIPVYNGAPMLRECLDSLLAQSYQDFIIVIADNASTDGTPDICAEYAARDSRIKIIRHSENMGALENFKHVLATATTEFFMWRADDDYSDNNFIEELVKTLDENLQAQLAAPRIITRKSSTEYVHETPFIDVNGSDFPNRLIERLFNYHVSICYGLWRTEYVQKTTTRVCDAYPHGYACDHLIVLSAFLDDAVVGNNNTLFTQRTYSPIKGDGMRGKKTLSVRIAMLERLMPLFYTSFENEVRLRNLPLDHTKKILSIRNEYTYKKLRASKNRIFRLKAKKILFDLIGKTPDEEKA